MLNRFKKFIYDIKCAIVSSYMCLRFPFLYTRNAFSGLHCNCWTIRNFHKKHYKDCVIDVYVKTERVNGLEKQHKGTSVFDLNEHGIDLWCNIFGDDVLYFHKGAEVLLNLPVFSFFKEKPIRYNVVANYNADKRYIDITIKYMGGEGYDYNNCPDGFKFIYTVVIKKFMYNWIMFLDWIEKYPYQWINIIPTYSWYDAIPHGWRKAFGLQMMKEIKAELLRVGGRKDLRSMRITDVKEKWGSLQVYCSSCGDVHKIIEKYEYISFRTCIKCGRPAHGVTNGWVTPLCEDCFHNSKSISMTPFYREETKWYGYTGSQGDNTIINKKYIDDVKKQEETE